MKERQKGSKKRTSFAVRCLPEEYELYERIDLTKDKKAAVRIFIWTAFMAIGMIVPMLFKHPLLNMSELSAFEFISGIMATAAALIVYVFLHEGVHGILIRLFTGEAPSFGLELRKGVAYAGSSWYFRKTPYIAIALAPLAVWTIVIGLLLMDIDESYPRGYFWFLYIVQIFNVTGSAGDLYVACVSLRMPENVLISDSGAEMNFYLKKTVR